MDGSKEPELLPRHISILTRYDSRTRNGAEKLSPIERICSRASKPSWRLFPYAVRERKAYKDMESLGLLGAIARKKARTIQTRWSRWAGRPLRGRAHEVA